MMQNSDTCNVYLWDMLVGELILVEDTVYFKYDSEFDMEISPLELRLSKAQYNFKHLEYQYGLAGVFNDSLPDSFGMKVIDSYFDTVENIEPNIIDKLLFIGDVSLGALSYRLDDKSEPRQNIAIKINELKSAKKKLLMKNSSLSIRIAIDMYISFSPTGGAKEKALLSYNEKEKTFYIGEALKGDTSLIVKIDEREKPNYGVEAISEYIYSNVAEKCGINTPKCFLFEDEDGYTHFGIERFDIKEDGQRVHVHTVSGLLHMKKSKRIDYNDVMRIAKKELFVPQKDVDELYKRMVFNYIYNNCDDHLKNTSFMMDKKGNWRLSPAYDLTYNTTKGRRDLVLKINRKLSSDATYEDFVEVAKLNKVENYNKILNDVEDSVHYYNAEINNYFKDDKFKYYKMELLDTQKINRGV